MDVEGVRAESEREEARVLDLADAASTREAADGMDAIVHLGAIPTEAAWERLLDANVRATFNVFEAARTTGVRRVVFASSNHATGFYGRGESVSPRDRPRPDSLYGVSKVAGEALGSLYADKFGLEVVALRIGAFSDEPPDGPSRPMWLSPADAFRLVWAALSARGVGFEIVYGFSKTGATWWDNEAAAQRVGFAAAAALDLAGGDPHGERPQGYPYTERDFHGAGAEG